MPTNLVCLDSPGELPCCSEDSDSSAGRSHQLLTDASDTLGAKVEGLTARLEAFTARVLLRVPRLVAPLCRVLRQTITLELPGIPAFLDSLLVPFGQVRFSFVRLYWKLLCCRCWWCATRCRSVHSLPTWAELHLVFVESSESDSSCSLCCQALEHYMPTGLASGAEQIPQ